MHINYIDHSGFLISTPTNTLLFDYYRGNLPKLDPTIPLTIFASHHHPDHFVPEIFQIGEQLNDTHYFLGCDITLNQKTRALCGITDQILSRCKRVHHNDTLTSNNMQIRALRSTDLGVAFDISINNTHIYHAGDTSLWLWREDPNFDRAQTERFYFELEKLRQTPIEIAFLPLDPRLGDEYWRGFDAFARLIAPTHIFPMHMNGDYDIISRLKRNPISAPYRDRIIDIHHPNESFLL